MENKMLEHRSMILVIGIITGFIFITSFTAFYTTENFSSVCGCKLPLWVIVISLASLGVFVGTFTYYVLTKNYINDKKKLNKAIFKTLDFLENDEKVLVKNLIENNGKIYQSKLKDLTGFDKVKISRIINSLEKKRTLKKEKRGMTNLIILDEDLAGIFI